MAKLYNQRKCRRNEGERLQNKSETEAEAEACTEQEGERERRRANSFAAIVCATFLLPLNKSYEELRIICKCE